MSIVKILLRESMEQSRIIKKFNLKESPKKSSSCL